MHYKLNENWIRAADAEAIGLREGMGAREDKRCEAKWTG